MTCEDGWMRERLERERGDGMQSDTLPSLQRCTCTVVVVQYTTSLEVFRFFFFPGRELNWSGGREELTLRTEIDGPEGKGKVEVVVMVEEEERRGADQMTHWIWRFSTRLESGFTSTGPWRGHWTLESMLGTLESSIDLTSDSSGRQERSARLRGYIPDGQHSTLDAKNQRCGSS